MIKPALTAVHHNFETVIEFKQIPFNCRHTLDMRVQHGSIICHDVAQNRHVAKNGTFM